MEQALVVQALVEHPLVEQALVEQALVEPYIRAADRAVKLKHNQALILPSFSPFRHRGNVILETSFHCLFY